MKFLQYLKLIAINHLARIIMLCIVALVGIWSDIDILKLIGFFGIILHIVIAIIIGAMFNKPKKN